MAHHQPAEKEKNIDSLYYLVAVVCGLFTGVVIDNGIGWIITFGVLFLLFAALFLQVFVRGREQR
ncbi:hypothetical protein [Mucilaginibacter ginsenosidivorans]|uniref:Uncharacterized protein n=1 Tax=Mucilaginibacter ginsenosidivorans TaxID=398053 RepID=A0A5B8URS5_9SPHI|nr:hypothetical protein [Mucilaginibacter ginsenosidivorans]QEC61773.1 hypothetical protein FRZ54_03965 [Mucilaginibacter ginsenosidivorans]